MTELVNAVLGWVFREFLGEEVSGGDLVSFATLAIMVYVLKNRQTPASAPPSQLGSGQRVVRANDLSQLHRDVNDIKGRVQTLVTLLTSQGGRQNMPARPTSPGGVLFKKNE